MVIDRVLRRWKLASKLIASYLVILAAGGLATSVVGSWIVSSTIMNQAHRRVDRDLATARFFYQQRLTRLRRAVEQAAAAPDLPRLLAAGEFGSIEGFLGGVCRQGGCDFLDVTDSHGVVLLRVTGSRGRGDDLTWSPQVRAALAGEVAAATEILAADRLEREDSGLAARVRFAILPTPRASPTDRTEETAGMAICAAAPVLTPEGRTVGALYAGTLLNRNFALVDNIWKLLYEGERFRGREVGTVTIFQRDVRIATTVTTAGGERAVGTRVSAEVGESVLARGETWNQRAFVVNDWYLSAYEPIRGQSGEIVGILYVGLLEDAYTSIRDRVIVSFFAIASTGFFLILLLTYRMIRNLTQPIGEMAAATRRIAAGSLDQRVSVSSEDEIGQLAMGFNSMLGSLRQMKGDLEQWGKTLEQKVQQRTDELVAMQARMAEADRLAALGRLAAGVAHEINNPLGGILSLTALTLEDMDPRAPDRENLEEVIRQTERCRDIVKGLLDFSRQSEPRTAPADLNSLIDATLALVEKQALFHNIEVVRRLAPDLPNVVVDESQIQQVFINIILNAVQAMQERGRLVIETRLSGDRFVEAAIIDTGPGIPPEVHGRIFEPFFTTRKDGEGTGLGLAIAYGIMAKHGGTIEVESGPGSGATFIVRLPPEFA